MLALTLATMLSGFPKLALVDRQATRQTKALYVNLKKISKTGILFGHQNATEYGHG